MNPSAHEPIEIQVTLWTDFPELKAQNLFNLRMRYREHGNFQMFDGVYVPQELQPVLLAGDIQALHLDTLEVNSLAKHLLPGGPGYVLLGVRCRNGEEVRYVPSALTTAQATCQIFGVAACLLGCGLLAVTMAPLCGAISLVLGTHLIRTARAIPSNPFFVYKTYRP